jgi:hypothetical protein
METKKDLMRRYVKDVFAESPMVLIVVYVGLSVSLSNMIEYLT